MAGNCKILIDEMESLALLDHRYSTIRVVNCDRQTGKYLHHAGSLSVVFNAIDTLTNKPVAIKFLTPDLSGPRAGYRFDLFQREVELLNRMNGSRRCVELIQDINQFDLQISNPVTGQTLTKDTYYFVTEWLDNDINSYFLQQHAYSAEEKLQVFRSILLAVSQMHRNNLYHRDIKLDNFRLTDRDGLQYIVMLDLGTAAALDSIPLGTAIDYSRPVGAPLFAPIEAHCGLSGIRELGVYSDIYSLGCLLHDLFNLEYFYDRLTLDNGNNKCFSDCYAHMVKIQNSGADQLTMQQEWDRVIMATKRQVTIPSIDGPNSTVPASIKQLLDKLLSDMTAPDYRDRIDDDLKILRVVDSAILVLRNIRLEQKRLQEAKDRRHRRMEKRKERDTRLQQYLYGGNGSA